jgi:hypothetical protein
VTTASAHPLRRLWSLSAPPPGLALDARSVAQLLALPDQPSAAASMLDFVNQHTPVDYISLVAHEPGPPHQLEGRAAEPGRHQVTTECFAAYRRAHYPSDEITGLALQMRRQGLDAPLLAMHLRAVDLPSSAWRQEVYERRQLADRLSFVYLLSPQRVVSVNLYRRSGRGACSDAELDHLLGLGPLLRQAHRLALRALPGAANNRPAQVQRALQQLALHAPALSPREREVCARIACGLGADGIAADLDISPLTVASLRKRAYLKLGEIGIHGGRLPLARWLCSLN